MEKSSKWNGLPKATEVLMAEEGELLKLSELQPQPFLPLLPPTPQKPALVSLLQDHWTFQVALKILASSYLSIVGLGRRKLRWCLQLKIILIKWHILWSGIFWSFTLLYIVWKDNTCTWFLKILHKTIYSENVLSYSRNLPDVFPEFIYASTSIIHTTYHPLLTCDSILTTWCCTLPSFLLIHSFNKYLPSSYYVPGTIPSDKKKAGSKTKCLPLKELML